MNASFFTESKSIFRSFLGKALFLTTLLAACIASAQEEHPSQNDLLGQYIQSKGEGIILFDESNIKQFWTDRSVIARNGFIQIELSKKGNRFESIPLKIQLANVNVEQDCKIEVIAGTKGISFSVSDMQSKKISSSPVEAPLGRYYSISSIIHMEDTSKAAFSFSFSSTNADMIDIKAIILVFSRNKDFLSSQGVLRINKDNSVLKGGKYIFNDLNSFGIELTKKTCNVLSAKKILVTDNEISFSAKIKNSGNKAITIQTGYEPYIQYRKDMIGGNNYPHKKESKVLEVISSEKNSNTIIVNSYDEWKKGCTLALNAKDDLSDIPNFTFAKGKIEEVRKLENGYAEIIMDKPQTEPLNKGAKVRISGNNGSSTYVYTCINTIQPEEEVLLQSKLKKNDNHLSIVRNALSRGVYYVIPFIIIIDQSGNGEGVSVQISDFSISY